MKGESMLKILEVLETGAHNLGALFEIFLSGYEASYRKLRSFRPLYKTPLTDELREYLKERHNFQALISRLKKDGLIQEKDIKRDGGLFFLTSKGKAKFDALQNRRSVSLPSGVYDVQSSNELKIIIFDIPEKERKKRDWLRGVLKRLKFTMLQKSVWVGKSKAPHSFIDDLRKLHLLPYVEIFVITKSGSLKKL